ncbi:N-carbamoylputrescine amidohydrolase [Campylobacter lari]|uniref:N-carbamoylputrescine amidohydrolase n=1 Tax=Campylobacter lari (strain RM2100 / D67 / ATCC BAA-1060) TaxID=306263 RepID=B9KCD1_CAMLR|nr:N-carbamoylputrescine amidohydrolase [Campylobacter lari]ACM64220.1 N-carbamoylputrescine amidohydrolase [Campylobacter lari RM2100]EAJ0336451.1 N-carbamoylputrescine amidohydrolase [Campylobacter lari]EAK8103068.1 N-carbamoylputrescine amidohydrolase [Campylobacter lari]EAK9941339.1 N-carbamoylputrescine amidohydrolase [Campylobacter lari]EHJ7677605.1 N-carbamoylputrescine amidohydrolase [Campylobacter lari]
MKLALIQQEFKQNKEKTIEKTCELIKQAAKEKAELVCLQELHQTQYFCQSENTNFFDLANDYEEDINFWSNVAKENKVVLVTSLFEKRSAGLYHNTSVVFEKDGSIAGKYRKMHIPDDPCFYEKFYFTPGDLGFEPIQTSVGKLGVLICWDQWYPEAARLMALKGAQILIYPTAIGWFDKDEKEEKQRQLEAWIGVQRGHAIANGLPVVAINRVGFEKDESGVEEGIRFWGNSFVFGAQGEELFRADDKQELCKIVEIDMQRCENVRRWWPFLRDRRIEYFHELNKRFID